MTDEFPDPTEPFPVRQADGTPYLGSVFLAPATSHPRLRVGAYTYASAFDPPPDWAAHLAPYLFDFSPERLVIGKFCQIADGVKFITSSANHRYDGISTYPFAIFGGGERQGRASLPGAGPDTVIGNDVWIGQGAKVLPGTRIGNGVIIGAGAVVTGEVRAYSIVAGNPAKAVRRRFPDAVCDRLQQIAWWDWPIDVILTHEDKIMGCDVDALAAVAP